MFNFMNSRMGIFILCICGYNTKAAICFSSYFYSVRNGGHAEKYFLAVYFTALPFKRSVVISCLFCFAC